MANVLDIDDVRAQELLLLMGEELKRPLVSITQLSELKGSSKDINLQAKQALRTLDNIILLQRVNSGQIALKLEPVHLGSILQTVSNEMNQVMKESECSVKLNIQSSLIPADVDKRLIHAAVQSMWQAMTDIIQYPKSQIVCAISKSNQEIKLSIISPNVDFKKVNFSKININSSQPIANIAGPATNLLTAKSIFSLFGGELKKTSSYGMNGFGVSLNASQQLQMV